MSKRGDQFAAVWKRINDIEISRYYEPSNKTLESGLTHLANNQRFLIAVLVEAGILLEKDKEDKKYLEFDGKKYTTRKVK